MNMIDNTVMGLKIVLLGICNTLTLKEIKIQIFIS